MTALESGEILNTGTSPPAFDAYDAWLRRAWAELLARPGTTERDFQLFLERHPSLLPDLYALTMSGHHGPLLNVVYSQPRLPGPVEFRPDFMWIGLDSAAVTAVLVEIEDPAKRQFTRDGEFTADFTQARGQLQNWALWFEDEANSQNFKNAFGITRDVMTHRVFRHEHILIMGRRAEIEAAGWSAKKREVGRAANERFMTFDRLEPSLRSSGLPVVRVGGGLKRELNFISVCPMFRMSTRHAITERQPFANRESAISECKNINAERKAFLIGRLPYWDDRAKNPKSGFFPNELRPEFE